MKVIQGDLIQFAKGGYFDVIVHGCNCFCTMGRGIAPQIKNVFPESYRADLETLSGCHKKLGTYSKAVVGELTILNAYTQFDYRGSGVLVNYVSVDRIFKSIAIEFKGKRIGFPKIGAGLAGGDWKKIEAIIKGNLSGECDFTLVEFRG